MNIDSEKSGKRVAVIGGGASGCMAAIAAAEAGCRVTLLEKNEKLAKKIYATGNGRCNLTNLFLDASCYHTGPDDCFPGNRPETETGTCDASLKRVLSWIRQYSQEDLTAFFRKAGVLMHDREGWVYPRTDQAQTIVRALEKRIRALDIEVYLRASVEGICLTETKYGAPKAPESRASEAKACLREEEKSGRFLLTYTCTEDLPAAGTAPEKSFSRKEAGREGRPAIKTGRQKKGRDGRGGQRDLAARPAPSRSQKKSLVCDAVILCTGGLAGPSFGCSGDGYRMAEQFSHHIQKPLPALTQLVCDSPFVKRAAGVRCQARISLYGTGTGTGTGPQGKQGQPADPKPVSRTADFCTDSGAAKSGPAVKSGGGRVNAASGKAGAVESGPAVKSGGGRADAASGKAAAAEPLPVAVETGELQITEYGISGIPVFQLSRTAARLLDAGQSVRVRIDFLPEMTDAMFAEEADRRLREESRDQMLSDFLLGLAHRKVIDMILAADERQAETKAKRLPDDRLRFYMEELRGFTLPVTGTRSFDSAQVTCGGVPLGEIDDRFASVYCPGLYFAGEVLDVDGRCGGYNLQWAMTSGTLAGRAAAQGAGACKEVFAL